MSETPERPDAQEPAVEADVHLGSTRNADRWGEFPRAIRARPFDILGRWQFGDDPHVGAGRASEEIELLHEAW